MDYNPFPKAFGTKEGDFRVNERTKTRNVQISNNSFYNKAGTGTLNHV